MSKNQDRIKKLSEALDMLAARQEAFGKVIGQLREEIHKLKVQEQGSVSISEQSDLPKASEQSTNTSIEHKASTLQKITPTTRQQVPKEPRFPEVKSNLEKFIGENLISKIGILIIILGVGIGAKYAIDNDMVSPQTRIVLGYLVGLGLLGFALKLKAKYANFSAVLLSGAMTILYFITFTAYSFYDLIPQGITFALMAIFTIFTVLAAISYDKKIIALIGLVGAYAVPFLLSSGSGQVEILFSYMAIINTGILVVAVKKYWQLLYYAAFTVTWIIFISWIGFDYNMDQHYSLALIFLFVFFVIFYATFLANKLINHKAFDASDIVLLLLNSFIFFITGLIILEEHPTGTQLLGVFALGNAVLHFVISYIINQRKLASKNLQYLVSGMVLVFITLAVPIQLDGNWVTLIWTAEAALLFWLGRTKGIAIYEKLSYPLIILAFGSLLQDWAINYNRYYLGGVHEKITPLLNKHFLSSFIFIALLGFINYLNRQYKPELSPKGRNTLIKLFSYIIPSLFLFSIYYAFNIEIDNYWSQLYADSMVPNLDSEGYSIGEYGNTDLVHFKHIWIINYSVLFFTILSFVNIYWLKNRSLGLVNLLLNTIVIGTFLTQSLYFFSYLRESHLNQNDASIFSSSSFHIGIRYLSFVFLAGLLFASYKYIHQAFMKINWGKYFDLALQVIVLWVISSELIHWYAMAGSPGNYKLGLSILWGSYSFLLIVLGIWKKKKLWRLGAIGLFGVTLLKLFAYDISHLDTISKTIVFVLLGILLVVISFLYNKYKHVIFDDEE